MHKLDDRMMEAWLGGWSAVAQTALETVAMVAITAVQASGSGTITAQLLCDPAKTTPLSQHSEDGSNYPLTTAHVGWARQTGDDVGNQGGKPTASRFHPTP